MPTVGEPSSLYENVLLGPHRGPDVCSTCFNFTVGYASCYACAHGHQTLDAVLPVSYGVAGEQLHHALASYKRLDGDVARRLGAILAAILQRFLSEHEACVAGAANAEGFDVVTTVPSGDQTSDDRHPLRTIVGELVGPSTRGFTTGTPWLPPNEPHLRNVADPEQDEDSVLALFRRLIRLRRDFGSGTRLLDSPPGTVMLERAGHLVAVNLGDASAPLARRGELALETRMADGADPETILAHAAWIAQG